MATAALAHATRIGNDDGAPWQAAAEHDGGNRVDDRVLCSLNDRTGHVLKSQLRSKFSQANGFAAHFLLSLNRECPAGTIRLGSPGRAPAPWRAHRCAQPA